MTTDILSDTKSHLVILKESTGSTKDGCKYSVDLKRRTKTKVQNINSSYSTIKDFFKV
jgi:hypothetical protein